MPVGLFPAGLKEPVCSLFFGVYLANRTIYAHHRWVDHYGTMIVTNNGNRDHAVVSFTQNGVFKKESRRNVEAQVRNERVVHQRVP